MTGVGGCSVLLLRLWRTSLIFLALDLASLAGYYRSLRTSLVADSWLKVESAGAVAKPKVEKC